MGNRPLDTWDVMRSRSWDPLPGDSLLSLLSSLGVGNSPRREQQEKVLRWLGSAVAQAAPPGLKRAARSFAGVASRQFEGVPHDS